MNRLKSVSSALAISLLAFGSVTAEEDAEVLLHCRAVGLVGSWELDFESCYSSQVGRD